ncbi:MAG: glycine betaine ABC transporter substrate-binding protein [Eubacterium ramulus]
MYRSYTTDAQLMQCNEFILLEDDKHFCSTPYNIIPVVRQEVIDAHPDVAEIINKIGAAIDTETMTKLNAQVDIDKEEYEDVATDFYATIK